MDIEKNFRIEAAQAEVWEFITSAEKVAVCIPGVRDVETVSPGTHTGAMNIKVGPIRTLVNAEVQEREQRTPEFASYIVKGDEGGGASQLTADVGLSLAPVGAEATDVNFVAKVVIAGRLAKFSGGVMNALADTMSEEFTIACRRELESGPAKPAELGLWTRIVIFLKSLFGSSRNTAA